jgi:hypothetical protein
MTYPHGNPRWTNDQLRAHLEEAHNSAIVKWRAYLGDLALGYWDAYNQVKGTLENIAALRKTREEQASLFWSIILPGIAGGFLGGIISLRTKAIVDSLVKGTVKFKTANVAVDTVKTVVSDTAKFETRKFFQDAVDSNPWKPTAMDPAQFKAMLDNELDHFMVSIKDQLLNPRDPHYRDIMFVLYNSPFIWNAPTADDLAKWPRGRLALPLEIVLWADWSNRRDKKYWVDRIIFAQDHGGALIPYVFNEMAEYETEFNDLNPILERLTKCGVQSQYVTQFIPQYGISGPDYGIPRSPRGGHRFLNPLWIRTLAGRYQNTLLGNLLTRAVSGRPGAADLTLRPGTRSGRVSWRSTYVRRHRTCCRCLAQSGDEAGPIDAPSYVCGAGNRSLSPPPLCGGGEASPREVGRHGRRRAVEADDVGHAAVVGVCDRETRGRHHGDDQLRRDPGPAAVRPQCRRRMYLPCPRFVARQDNEDVDAESLLEGAQHRQCAVRCAEVDAAGMPQRLVQAHPGGERVLDHLPGQLIDGPAAVPVAGCSLQRAAPAAAERAPRP